MYLLTAPRRPCAARERAASYEPQPAPPPTLASAMTALRQARAQLAAVDLDACDGEDVADALLGLLREQSALAAQEARLIREADRREVYRRDACVSTKGWLRLHTQLGQGAITRRVQRARLLNRMPLLAGALASGDIATEHVDVITRRAIPARVDRIAEHEEALTQLARDADPPRVAIAVKAIVEHVDPDGADDPPACEADDLREFTLRKGIHGLGNVAGVTTPLLSELFLRARDLYSTPDPPDLPLLQRRTPAQRWHDALVGALSVAVEKHPGSAVDGVKTHVSMFLDLHTTLGEDEIATLKAKLGTFGELTPEAARHLLATTNPTLRLVLGLGPWLPVSVGRARRSLPDWMRGALQLAHPHCTGPGCDRPFAWCEADHRDEWWEGGITALVNAAPLCTAHNNLKHSDGWVVTFNAETGVTTWASRDGSRRIDIPPPDS